jgi:hypothetical protein
MGGKGTHRGRGSFVGDAEGWATAWMQVDGRDVVLGHSIASSGSGGHGRRRVG